MYFVRAYFKKTKVYTPAKFILVSTLIAVAGKFGVGLLIGIFSTLNGISMDGLLETGLGKISNPVYLFFILCIMLPVVETIIFQWLPITLLEKITSNIKLIIGIDAALFAFAHWDYSFIYVLTVLPLALVLAWSFIAHNNDSLLKAGILTASIHALYNFTAFVPIAFL
jgi:membrane protease YdiL (CAAX protease family)